MGELHDSIDRARVPDAELEQICFDRVARAIQLELKCDGDGAGLTVRFEGVRSLECEGMALQNVAGDLLPRRVAELSVEERAKLLRFLPSGVLGASDTRIEQELNRRGLVIYFLESAAGLELLIVCERVRVGGQGVTA